MQNEAFLHQQVCDWLRLTHHEVIFSSDFAAGLKLSIGQASRAKRLRSSRGWPDLMIAEPRGGYHGLFIELKREGTTVYLKDGKLSTNAHIQEQAQMLQGLLDRGYLAMFSVGYEQTIKNLEGYLRLPFLWAGQPQSSPQVLQEGQVVPVSP